MWTERSFTQIPNIFVGAYAQRWLQIMCWIPNFLLWSYRTRTCWRTLWNVKFILLYQRWCHGPSNVLRLVCTQQQVHLVNNSVAIGYRCRASHYQGVGGACTLDLGRTKRPEKKPTVSQEAISMGTFAWIAWPNDHTKTGFLNSPTRISARVQLTGWPKWVHYLVASITASVFISCKARSGYTSIHIQMQIQMHICIKMQK